MGILDVLFPKYCVGCKKLGSYLCADCFALISFDVTLLCVVCNRPSIDGQTHPVCKTRYALDGALASIAYKGVVKKLLYSFKYKPYVSHLQETLVDFFYEGLIQKEVFYQLFSSRHSGNPALAGASRIKERSWTGQNDKEALFVPIPLHKDRLRKRGYNHAQLLAQGLAKRFGITVFEPLERVKKTTPQFGLNLQKRKENVAGAFRLKAGSGGLIRGKTILLVDDLLTSGTTFAEAGKVLKKAGAKRVWGIALARDE